MGWVYSDLSCPNAKLSCYLALAEEERGAQPTELQLMMCVLEVFSREAFRMAFTDVASLRVVVPKR